MYRPTRPTVYLLTYDLLGHVRLN